MVEEISADLFEKVSKKNEAVVIEFWAEWCGPCKVLAPVFEAVAKDFEGKMKFFACDIDANQEFAQSNGVMSIPTIIVFKHGEEAGRFVGGQSEQELKQALKAFL